MGSLELPLIQDSKQPAGKQMKSRPRLLAARKVHLQTTIRHCHTGPKCTNVKVCENPHVCDSVGQRLLLRKLVPVLQRTRASSTELRTAYTTPAISSSTSDPEQRQPTWQPMATTPGDHMKCVCKDVSYKGQTMGDKSKTHT